jgi:hypothetical protein
MSSLMTATASEVGRCEVGECQRHSALRPREGGLWILEARGVKRGQASSATKRYSKSATVADVAKQVGVSARTARDRLKKAEACAGAARRDAAAEGVRSRASAARA